MSLDTATTAITDKLAFAPPLNAKILFDFGPDGVVHIDATQTPPVIIKEHKDSDVTLTCSMATFEAILNGTQDPNMAFMMGKLKVKGSMGLALKLSTILED